MYAMVKLDMQKFSQEKDRVDVSGLVMMEVTSIEAWKKRVLAEITYPTHEFIDVFSGKERHYVPNSKTMMEGLEFSELDKTTFELMKGSLRAKNNGTAYWCIGTVPRFLVL